MRRKLFDTIISLLLCLSLLAPPGALALWSYAAGRADPGQLYCGVRLRGFEYPPADVLPSGQGQGEDHKDVIDAGDAGDRISGYRTVIKKADGGNWTATGSKKGNIGLKTVTVGAAESFLSFDPRNGEWNDGEIPAE